VFQEALGQQSGWFGAIGVAFQLQWGAARDASGGGEGEGEGAVAATADVGGGVGVRW
jgi:hypothetical protein